MNDNFIPNDEMRRRIEGARQYGGAFSPEPPKLAKPRPRVGHINFLNCLPILWGLAKGGALGDLNLTQGTPDQLCKAFTESSLDICPITLVEALRHSDELWVLPDIAIGCDGPVMSCLIVSEVPLDELDGASVALTSTSRTSVKLAQLLLGEVVGVQPDYFVAPPNLDDMLGSASAAVIIGDAALKAALYEAPRRKYYVYDLGTLWKEWTGLPFVFAVFGVRKEFALREPEIVKMVHRHLLAARDLGLAEIEAVCRQADNWEEFDVATLRKYYTEALCFDLGPNQLAAISEFATRIDANHRIEDVGSFMPLGLIGAKESNRPNGVDSEGRRR